MKNNLEIERKFIIKLPDLDYLKTLPSYTESEIEQIYLEAERGRTHRIRKRQKNGISVYTETEKIRVDAISAIENEREIDEKTYLSKKQNQKKDTKAIIKRRITVEFSHFNFEIDIYPEWHESCIMEVELPAKDTQITLPPFITAIEEVTGKKEYSNASMAKSFPPEKC